MLHETYEVYFLDKRYVSEQQLIIDACLKLCSSDIEMFSDSWSFKEGFTVKKLVVHTKASVLGTKSITWIGDRNSGDLIVTFNQILLIKTLVLPVREHPKANAAR
jgi:hypothetical protein